MITIATRQKNEQHQVLTVFRFWVEIDGLIVGGFSEVSGLQAETEYEQFQEGGVNDYVHFFPKQTKYPPLVLKRGMTHSGDLWEWYENTVSGKIQRKSGSVILHNFKGQEECRWNFFEAYPVKWTGPELNASRSDVAVETIELVHNGIKTIFSNPS